MDIEQEVLMFIDELKKERFDDSLLSDILDEVLEFYDIRSKTLTKKIYLKVYTRCVIFIKDHENDIENQPMLFVDWIVQSLKTELSTTKPVLYTGF